MRGAAASLAIEPPDLVAQRLRQHEPVIAAEDLIAGDSARTVASRAPATGRRRHSLMHGHGWTSAPMNWTSVPSAVWNRRSLSAVLSAVHSSRASRPPRRYPASKAWTYASRAIAS